MWSRWQEIGAGGKNSLLLNGVGENLGQHPEGNVEKLESGVLCSKRIYRYLTDGIGIFKYLYIVL